MAFKDCVFINCPFDDKYRALLRPLLFTVLYLEFTPRIALERSDSGETRFEKICQLIRESKYAIHDLSRMEATAAGELFRLNMPFELGLDIGCRKFSNDQRFADKQCLILETKKYRYQAAISDLSNSDIAYHADEPEQVVVKVRNWLAERVEYGSVDGAARIWGHFMDFMALNDEDLRAKGHSPAEIADQQTPELIRRMEAFLPSIR